MRVDALFWFPWPQLRMKAVLTRFLPAQVPESLVKKRISFHPKQKRVQSVAELSVLFD